MKLTTLLYATLPLAVPAASNAAFTLVNWNPGGNSTASTVPLQGSWTFQGPMDLDGDTASDDSRFGLTIGNRTPVSPDYSGGTFYGGISVNTIDNIVPGSLDGANYGVHNAGTDHIVVHTQHAGNHHHTWDALFYWDKADFLNSGSIGSVSLDSSSLLTVSFLSSSLQKGDEHLHYLIRDGSQWYISQKYYGPTAGADQLGPLPSSGSASMDPNLTNWAPYNPSGLNLHYATTTGSAHTFTDITAFGFLMDSEVFSSNSSRVEISGFSVQAVPEPSACVFLLAGLTPFFRRRR